jgi:putative transcriptional regulator
VTLDPKSPSHHPDEALLLDYAAGSLNEPASLVIATHLALCPDCRRLVAGHEAVGGVLLEETPPVEPAAGALAALMTRLDEPMAPLPVETSPIPSAPILPRPLRDYVGGDLGAVPWKRLIGGIEVHDIAVGSTPDRFKTRLMRIKGGVAVPRHTHEGFELVMVVEGGFSDGGRHYDRGDVTCSDGEVDHSPVADADGGCVCLAVTDAPLRLTGPLMRLLNPFVRF